MISVIVPMYNSADFLERCVDSIINNTFEDFELFLIDDGSSDDTLAVADNLAKKDNRIKVIKQEHKGVSYTRNNGLKLASGKYIAFIDSDDYVDENYFEDLYRKIEEDDLDWVHCGYCVHFPDGKTWIRLFKEKKNYYNDDIKKIIENFVFNSNDQVQLFSPCMSLYRKKIIDDNNLIFVESIYYGEDVIFNYNYVKKINSFGIVNKILYHVVRRKGSIINTWANNINVEDVSKFIDVFVEQIRGYKDQIDKDKQLYFVIYLFSLFSKTIYRLPYSERTNLIKKLVKSLNENENCRWLLNQMKPLSKEFDLRTKVMFFIVKYNLYNIGYIIWRIIHIFVPYDESD